MMAKWFSGGDTSDLFHPILVKEVRQGIRARSFVLTFISVHLIMIFILMGMVGTITSPDAHSSDLEGWTFFFWAVLFIPLLVILPLLGFGTIHREIEQKTSELLFLTHLSSRGIVFGKWLALATQALLFTVAIIPYFTLRFFLGGVDLLHEFTILFYLFLGSLLFIGAGLIVSPIAHRFVRILLIIAYLLGLLIVLQASAFFFFAGDFLGSVYSGPNMFVICGIILPLMLALMLEYAAQRIAPEAENHTVPKRLIGILLGSLVLTLAYLEVDGHEFYGFLAFLVIGLLVLDALSEPPLRTMGALRVYRRFPKPLRFPSRLLIYPGWPQSLFFAVLLLGSLTPFAWMHNTPHDEALLIVSLLFGFFLFPFAFIYAIYPTNPAPLRLVFLLTLLQYLLGAMLNLTTLTPAVPDLTILGTFIPGAVFAYLTINDSLQEVTAYFPTLITTNILCLAYLIYKGRPFRRRLREMEYALDHSPASPAEPPVPPPLKTPAPDPS